MPPFAHQVNNRPVFLSLLKMHEVQISQFPSSQAAAKQDGENRAIPLAFECIGIRRLPKPARLICRKPVSKPHAEFLDTLHATNSGRELRAKQTGVCCFVRQPSHGGQSPVDSSRGEAAVLEGNPEPGHHDFVERQSGLRTVPADEFIDGMPISSF
jgi:hypothetical protein